MILLRNAQVAGWPGDTPTGPLDILLDADTATIAQVRPADTGGADSVNAEVHDLAGYLVLPAPAEPHAHLDKALLGERSPNRTGDLAGAIEAMISMLPTITHDDLVARAHEAALLSLANGVTALRSHADVTEWVGLRHVKALVEVREALAPILTIQVVALVSRVAADGTVDDRLLREAVDAGADIVGGCPHLDPDPRGCLLACMDAAEATGRAIDLHTDENTDPTSRGLAAMAAEVSRRGFGYGATAGHCVSLGVQPAAEVRATAAAVAAAGIAVVTLPQTNLFLQGRDQPVATPRGLTAVRALLDAGVTVAAGGDNVRDPFNTMGRGDPMEAASLLVVAGHLLPGEAYAAVSAGARAAMGLPSLTLTPGAPAELLAIRAASLTEAVAAAHPDRLVFSRGRLVARTSLTRTFHDTGTFHDNAMAPPHA